MYWGIYIKMVVEKPNYMSLEEVKRYFTPLKKIYFESKSKKVFSNDILSRLILDNMLSNFNSTLNIIYDESQTTKIRLYNCGILKGILILFYDMNLLNETQFISKCDLLRRFIKLSFEVEKEIYLFGEDLDNGEDT